MQGTQQLRRATAVALAVVLLGLTIFSVVGTAITRRAARAAEVSVEVSDAYHDAYAAVAAEESLERLYRIEPGPAVRAEHSATGRKLESALRRVLTHGTAADAALAGDIRVDHAAYLVAVGDMFAAQDAGDLARVLRIDETQTDPVFERMTQRLESTADDRAAAANRALTHLSKVENVVFVATLGGAVAGLGLITALLAVGVGLTRASRRYADESRYRATHDTLTGLPNRVLLAERLEAHLNAGEEAALLLIDIDRFRQVNNTLGHAIGDELLQRLTGRIKARFRVTDLVARLSGDEFAVLLPGIAADRALALADRMIADAHRSFLIDGVTVDVEVSVGVAVAPAHGDTPEALLRAAEAAKDAAKDAKTGAVVYTPQMNPGDHGHLSLLGDLRRALEAGNQLLLHYQPKVELTGGTLHGVEALLRWHHPVRGMVPPADFIPIAESTGLINRLTTAVLRLAVAQGRQWLMDGHPVPIAVNLSPRCLLDPTLLDRVVGLLTEYELPARLLRLEVTETAVMANPAAALATLRALSDLGIALSIDDFGTGYSSMAYLKQLPVNELKIDRGFVSGLGGDGADAVLIRGAIDLGHNLGLTVVAEGVETTAEVAVLSDLGCDIAQGYHFARPMPADQLSGWLASAASLPG
jgi:diguanylate cyclase (GGDEF)-like protein